MGDDATSDRTIQKEARTQRSSARRGNFRATRQPPEAPWLGKLPAKGIPLPQNVGWDAFATLLATFGRTSPQVGVVLWILETVQQRRPLSARALSRDLHTRPQTAAKIIHPKDAAGETIPGWVEWARYVTGTGGCWSQVTHTPVLTEIRKELREHSGISEYSANSMTPRVIEDTNDKNGNSN